MNETRVKLDPKVILRIVIGLTFVLIVIFLSAGNLSYRQGYLYIFVMMGSLLLTYLSIRKNTDLINERIKPGKGVYFIGQYIFVWARRTNNYFSSVVRIQKDRGQKVCDLFLALFGH